MPRRSPTTPASQRYWQRRVSSPAFARQLTRLIAAELRVLADEKVKDVVDMALIHDVIERSEKLLAVDALAGVMVALRATVRRRARKTKRSLGDVLGEQLASDVEAAAVAATNLTRDAEDFIARMMERDLVQSLMTELVYTAIVSFNRRVNPLFGSLALLMVDAQIKSFIRMFMPMLQGQATAFLIDRKHHALFADFARTAVREVLREPLPQLVELFDRGGDTDAFLKRTARNPRLRRLVRDGARMVTDAIFHRLGGKRVGAVLLLDDNVEWLAKRLTAPCVAVLTRSHAAAFVAREIDRAVAGKGTFPSPSGRGLG